MFFDIFSQIFVLFEVVTSSLNMTMSDDFPTNLVIDHNATTDNFTVKLPQCCSFDPGTDISHCDILQSLDEPRHTIRNNDWRHPINGIFPVETSNLKFEVRRPKCLKGFKSIKIQFDGFDGSRDGHFLKNSYFGHNEHYYSPLEYCINGITDEMVDVLTCTPECSAKQPCIRKCCRPDEIYSFQKRECIDTPSANYKPHFYHDMSNKLSDEEQEEVHPHYIVNFPRSFKYNCAFNKTQFLPAGELLASYLSILTHQRIINADFRVRTDGQIIFRTNGAIEGTKLADGTVVNRNASIRKCNRLMTENYCLEGAGGYGNPIPFSNDEEDVFLATCAAQLLETPRIGPLSFLYGNTMICSSFFSFMTVLVYLALKEKQNIHGWTIISYASSMFFMYIFLGLAHLIRYYTSNDVLKTNICTIIGIGSHFFSLASFVWLTLINYDLWWTFHTIRPSKDDYARRWQLYFRYCLFGWGVPFAFISASLTIHFKYEEKAEYDCAETSFHLPAYGRESCEIKQRALGVYLYYPASALLLCNLVFFVLTTYKLCMHERSTYMATRTTVRNQHQSFQLFAKLFFVMGVTRVFEILTWAESGPTLTWYWAVFDIFNVLQAVAIFIIFVCKRDVIESLKKRFPILTKTKNKIDGLWNCRSNKSTYTTNLETNVSNKNIPRGNHKTLA